jgi:hypothetical protein
LVYLLLFILLFAINASWAYQRAAARVPGNSAYAIGVVQGSVVFPLLAAAGVACIWKRNRGFRGIVRVLFWGTVFLLFTKLSQLAGSTRQRRNHALHPTPGGVCRFPTASGFTSFQAPSLSLGR